jgi:2-keto-3-deoxy-L-rhamnonate aldolase RhmA
MTRDDIAEMYGEDLMFMDPSYFDAAIIGVAHQFNKPTVCYSIEKIIRILMKHDGMEPDEAIEYFEFNMMGAYVGENTPTFLEMI